VDDDVLDSVCVSVCACVCVWLVVAAAAELWMMMF